MTAHEFIKEYGLYFARKLVNEAPQGADCFMLGQVFGYAKTITDKGLREDEVRLADLKDVIKSHELIFDLGKTEAYKIVKGRAGTPQNEKTCSLVVLESALKDVELCQ